MRLQPEPAHPEHPRATTQLRGRRAAAEIAWRPRGARRLPRRAQPDVSARADGARHQGAAHGQQHLPPHARVERHRQDTGDAAGRPRPARLPGEPSRRVGVRRGRPQLGHRADAGGGQGPRRATQGRLEAAALDRARFVVGRGVRPARQHRLVRGERQDGAAAARGRVPERRYRRVGAHVPRAGHAVARPSARRRARRRGGPCEARAQPRRGLGRWRPLRARLGI